MKITNNDVVILYFVYDGESKKVYENGVFFKFITAEKRAKGLKEIGKRAFIVPLRLPKDKAFDYDFHTWCIGECIDDVRYLCSAWMLTASEREKWCQKKLTEYQKAESEFLKESEKAPIGYAHGQKTAIDPEEFYAVDSQYKQLELGLEFFDLSDYV